MKRPARKRPDVTVRLEQQVIDVSYTELPGKLTCRIDASSVLGSIALLAVIAVPGAVEGGMYMTAIVLTAIFGACAYLSVREDGKKR